jgi:surface antigen
MRYKVLVVTLALWAVTMMPAVRAQEGEGLEGPEQKAMTDTLQHALEFNRTRQASEWVNPDTGRSGAVVPVRTFENAQRQPCREFITTIIIGGKEEQGYGTACRQPDGSWQIVGDDLQGPPQAPPPQQVFVYPPPPVYYAYPSGFYGPSRIFLSFSYVYRSGHVHHGRRYLNGPAFRHRHPSRIRERVFVGPPVYRHYPWRHRRRHR